MALGIMDDAILFAFEQAFVDRLQCVPMAVRFKLDLAGVKITLRQWSRLSVQARHELLLSPCGAPEDVGRYRALLTALLSDQGEIHGPLPPGSTVPWEDARSTPPQVRHFAASRGAPAPSDVQWRALSPLQRFTLLKLSRDNHDNVNFIPALGEFGLYGDPQDGPDASYAARS